VAASAFYHLQRAKRPTSSTRVIPLTSYLGDLGCASFSPDGSQVTFDWRATNKRYYDIYVKLVKGGNALQLTREQPDSLLPTWSPDGSRIAFNRAGSVFLVSPLGQQESQLTTGVLAGNSAWSPDGRSLAIRDRLSEKEAWAIYSVSIATKEKRRLTFPPPRALDSWAAFSPDGTKLAFVRSLGANRGAGPIYVLPLKQGAPHGDPWRLTSAGSKVTALTWMPNGHEIIFAALGGHSGLSRIFVARVRSLMLFPIPTTRAVL
jgi:Tol biopolymer transport system component